MISLGSIRILMRAAETGRVFYDRGLDAVEALERAGSSVERAAEALRAHVTERLARIDRRMPR